MPFIDHAVAWLRGEIFEAWMLIVWGASLLIMAGLFWFFARTHTMQSLFLPFAIVGLLWGAAGAGSLYSNTNRIARYEQAHEADPQAFLEAERKHVDGFIWAYRDLLIAWSVAILLGLAAFMLWGGSIGRAVGLGLILFGTGGLMVDHTSEHNALEYDAQINRALKGGAVIPSS